MPLRGGNLPSLTSRDSTANGVRPSACGQLFQLSTRGKHRLQPGVFFRVPGLAGIGRRLALGRGPAWLASACETANSARITGGAL